MDIQWKNDKSTEHPALSYGSCTIWCTNIIYLSVVGYNSTVGKFERETKQATSQSLIKTTLPCLRKQSQSCSKIVVKPFAEIGAKSETNETNLSWLNITN